MATYTADAAQGYSQPRYNYNAPTQIVGRYFAGGVTISAGDVYQMVKIPAGALITGINVFGRAAGVAALTCQVGISGNATLFGTVTLSSTDQWLTIGSGASATQVMPYAVSVSDDTQPQHLVLQITTSATSSVTTTGTLGMVVQYLMRGQAGP